MKQFAKVTLRLFSLGILMFVLSTFWLPDLAEAVDITNCLHQADQNYSGCAYSCQIQPPDPNNPNQFQQCRDNCSNQWSSSFNSCAVNQPYGSCTQRFGDCNIRCFTTMAESCFSACQGSYGTCTSGNVSDPDRRFCLRNTNRVYASCLQGRLNPTLSDRYGYNQCISNGGVPGECCGEVQMLFYNENCN